MSHCCGGHGERAEMRAQGEHSGSGWRGYAVVALLLLLLLGMYFAFIG